MLLINVYLLTLNISQPHYRKKIINIRISLMDPSICNQTLNEYKIVSDVYRYFRYLLANDIAERKSTIIYEKIMMPLPCCCYSSYIIRQPLKYMSG